MADGNMLLDTVKNRYLLLLGEEGSQTFSMEREVEAITTTAHAVVSMAVKNFFYKPSSFSRKF